MLKTKCIRLPKNTIWALFWIIIILYSGLANMLFPFINVNIFEYAKFMLTIVCFFISFSPVNRIIGKRKMKYINIFVTIYLLIIFLSCIITIRLGAETPYRVFSNSRAFFAILLVYPIIYVGLKFHKDITLFDGIVAFIILMQVLRIFNVLIYDYTGVEILKNFIAVQVKNGHSTAVSNALDYVIPLYTVFRALNSKKKSTRIKFVIYSIIAIFFIVKIISSRMMILTVFSSIVILWAVNRQYKKNVIFAFVSVIISSVILINTNFFQEFMNTLLSANANDFNQGIYGNTVSARLLYIKTISEKNFSFLTGIGMISYGTIRYYYFFPEGATEDFGYLGDIYIFGIMIIIPIIMLLGKNLYMLKKYHGKKYADLLGALLTFLCVSGFSLSVFGARKILVLPIILAIYELIDYYSIKK